MQNRRILFIFILILFILSVAIISIFYFPFIERLFIEIKDQLIYKNKVIIKEEVQKEILKEDVINENKNEKIKICLDDFNLSKISNSFINFSQNIQNRFADYYFCESINQGDIKMCDLIPGEIQKNNCLNDYKGLDVILIKWAQKSDYAESDVEQCVYKNYANIEDEKERRSDCISTFEVYFKKNSSFCAKETNSDLKNSCYALFYKDDSRCEKISNLDIKNYCQSRLKLLSIIKSSDKALCADLLSDKESRRWSFLCEVALTNSCDRQLEDLKKSYCGISL